MKRILVIEDNLQIRENTAEILQLEGYEVMTAEAGKIGVEKALAEMPDLIFCDILMPGMDGYTVLYLLGKNKKTVSIPFIFLTAYSERSEIQKGLGLGASNYLIKPFTDIELLRAAELGLKKRTSPGTSAVCTKIDLTDFINIVKHNFDFSLSPNILSTKYLSKNEKLFAENEKPSAAYFVVKGGIKSYMLNDQGNEFVTNRHRPGEFLGYSAILENTDHKDNAVAEEDAELLLIPSADFLSLIYDGHAVSSQLVRLLVGYDINREEKLISLIYFCFRKRVVNSLLTIHEQTSSAIEKKKIIDSFEIKNEVSLAESEYLYKVLDELKTDRLIDIQKEKIIIKEERLLKRLVITE